MRGNTVVVDGSFSDTSHVRSGVRQGTVQVRSYFYATLMTSHPRSHLMLDSLLTTVSFIGTSELRLIKNKCKSE